MIQLALAACSRSAAVPIQEDKTFLCNDMLNTNCNTIFTENWSLQLAVHRD